MPLKYKMLSLLFIVAGLLVWCCALEKSGHETEEKVVRIGKDLPYIEGKHFRQGANTDPQGRELGLNNYFLRYDGKPILPVMGEIHYSRYPADEWEEAILKMKASGINLIALYCFWLHHEEVEGHTRFDGNRDVRHFIELCAKHGLWAFPRIGPWCHGECRNGGFPDWFAKKRSSAWDRGYDGELDPAVKRWYSALAEQFKGLYFKDGGPIIGIQVDNEVRSAGPDHWGYQYMSNLKEYASKVGIDVPLYTVTGWPGPQIPEDQVIGLFGGYPAAPWTGHAKEIDPPAGYLFRTDRRDKTIGSDWGFSDVDEINTPIYRHPLLTVEMGGGNQMTYHRRPRFIGKDMIALVYTRLGVGANMIGYYVFHGSQHPLSWQNEFPTQESKSSIHPYPNDYPMISYDFLAPLTEWGFIRDYYHDFKLIHHFLNDFGGDLASMYQVIPSDNPVKPANCDTLRYAVRSSGGRGYIFFNNYVRHLDMKDHLGVRFKLLLENEVLAIPDGTINILNNVYGIMPFNYDMQGVVLKYATAHPFVILNNGIKTYGFYAIEGMDPEFKFDPSQISKIVIQKGKKAGSNGFIKVNQLKPGKDCRIDITTVAGNHFVILVLTERDALYSYKFNLNGIETLLITEKMVFYDENTGVLEIRSLGENEFSLFTYPDINFKNRVIAPMDLSGNFWRFQVSLPKCKVPLVTCHHISDRNAFEKYCQSLEYITPKRPTYSHIFDEKQPYLVYELTLPDSLPQCLNDVLVEFDYFGNTAQIYADGLIIADDYYSGLKMPFGLRRHRAKLGKSRFLFQITPLLSDYEIYFEHGTELNFVNNTYAALNTVSATPEYAIRVKLHEISVP